MILQLRRWLPDRYLVVVADSSYAVLDLLSRCARLENPVTLITRLRLDAALYDPAPARHMGTKGRPRLKGERQPTLAQRLLSPETVWHTMTVQWYGHGLRAIEVATGTALWYHSGLPPVPIRWVLIRDPAHGFDAQTLLSTDQANTAQQIVEWCVLRWQVEVTFHEVRTHLGVETQRQWSKLAILRTTPALLALFSLVTLIAQQFLHGADLPVRQAAWYAKPAPTFADKLALVRQHLWPVSPFSMSPDIRNSEIIAEGGEYSALALFDNEETSISGECGVTNSNTRFWSRGFGIVVTGQGSVTLHNAQVTSHPNRAPAVTADQGAIRVAFSQLSGGPVEGPGQVVCAGVYDVNHAFYATSCPQ